EAVAGAVVAHADQAAEIHAGVVLAEAVLAAGLDVEEEAELVEVGLEVARDQQVEAAVEDEAGDRGDLRAGGDVGVAGGGRAEGRDAGDVGVVDGGEDGGGAGVAASERAAGLGRAQAAVEADAGVAGRGDVAESGVVNEHAVDAAALVRAADGDVV